MTTAQIPADEAEAMLERTFLRALEQAAALETSMETLLGIMLPSTAAVLGSYIARRAPELLAQRSPYRRLDGPFTDEQADPIVMDGR